MTGWLFALRSLYGAVLLLAPARALATLTRAPVDRPAANVARVLGARELVQAELVRRHPGRAAQLASAGVDGLHAATMFALAAANGGRRRLALRNGVTATALALASVAAARRGGDLSGN
ncbi:MAG: hypothetical protein ACLPTJ_07975 [Solirubrobacteraceae bacterium]